MHIIIVHYYSKKRKQTIKKTGLTVDLPNVYKRQYIGHTACSVFQAQSSMEPYSSDRGRGSGRERETEQKKSTSEFTNKFKIC